MRIRPLQTSRLVARFGAQVVSNSIYLSSRQAAFADFKRLIVNCETVFTHYGIGYNDFVRVQRSRGIYLAQTFGQCLSEDYLPNYVYYSLYAVSIKIPLYRLISEKQEFDIWFYKAVSTKEYVFDPDMVPCATFRASRGGTIVDIHRSGELCYSFRRKQSRKLIAYGGKIVSNDEVRRILTVEAFPRPAGEDLTKTGLPKELMSRLGKFQKAGTAAMKAGLRGQVAENRANEAVLTDSGVNSSGNSQGLIGLSKSRGVTEPVLKEKRVKKVKAGPVQPASPGSGTLEADTIPVPPDGPPLAVADAFSPPPAE